ncbi:MAG: glutamine--fructose-6-phosphate transaminase (isomerizing) [Acidobacteriota bacterium]
MCGIIGYVGSGPTVEVLMEGLQRLEYRGYDSAGLAVAHGGVLRVVRSQGKLDNLRRQVSTAGLEGSYGLGHTRWATHGRPNEENAHPHSDCQGTLVVVHNGIIENYLTLKARLASEGHRFATETDTEVIAHLVEKHYRGDLARAVAASLKELEGVFAFTALSARESDTIVGARMGPPLVVGIGDGENFIASDVPAFLSHTRDVVFLDDGDVAVLKRGGFRLLDSEGRQQERSPTRIAWDPIQAEKQGFKHFMLKEIYEQPRAVRDTLFGRYSLDSGRAHLAEVGLDEGFCRRIGRICVVACGTSWHAALVAKLLIESVVPIPVEADVASEFRYRRPILGAGDLVVGITQSGETADTLGALKTAQEKGARTLSICNALGSMATRVADSCLLTHAGPEIGVASTKTFTTQLAAVYLLALELAQARQRISITESRKRLAELARVGHLMEQCLALAPRIEAIAREFHLASNFLYLGRGLLYPIALEGALKLKELSYIHAEGYPAGEMKHGPIALIDARMPVVALALSGPLFEKMANNIQEAKARGARIIAFGTEGDQRLEAILTESQDHLVYLPQHAEPISPLVAVLPLQLLAYHIAVARGCDVDQPRNLAKSVTVE